MCLLLTFYTVDFANNALKKHSNSIGEKAISDYLTAFLHEQKSRNGGDGFTVSEKSFTVHRYV